MLEWKARSKGDYYKCSFKELISIDTNQGYKQCHMEYLPIWITVNKVVKARLRS